MRIVSTGQAHDDVLHEAERRGQERPVENFHCGRTPTDGEVDGMLDGESVLQILVQYSLDPQPQMPQKPSYEISQHLQ